MLTLQRFSKSAGRLAHLYLEEEDLETRGAKNAFSKRNIVYASRFVLAKHAFSHKRCIFAATNAFLTANILPNVAIPPVDEYRFVDLLARCRPS